MVDCQQFVWWRLVSRETLVFLGFNSATVRYTWQFDAKEERLCNCDTLVLEFVHGG